MQFDFTGAELFLAYWEGQASLQQVLDHPAYQTVCQHARLFSTGLLPQDIENALHGIPSLFYGLEGLTKRVARIRTLLEFIHAHEVSWVATASKALLELFPGENLHITVFPIIGYDMGIGLDGAVCLNCNHEAYLAEPFEFLFYIIHECVHVIYERQHRIPPLSEVVAAAQWGSYFHLWLQNEGYAVYAPLSLRRVAGALADRDYQVLFDSDLLEVHRVALLETLAVFQQEQALGQEEYIEHCFGSKRLTYRMGCELVRRIECAYGIEAVRTAFTLDGDRFVQEYSHLIET